MTFIFHGFAMKWEVGNKQREEKGEKERSLLEAYMYKVKGSVMYFKLWAQVQVRISSQKLCTLHFWMRVPIWIRDAIGVNCGLTLILKNRRRWWWRAAMLACLAVHATVVGALVNKGTYLKVFLVFQYSIYY